MSISKQGDRGCQLEPSAEVDQLRAQVAALEQLLEVYERETIEKSTKLEQTLVDLYSHTQLLTHAESALGTLRSMLNSMGDAVVVVDRQGQFLFLNPSAEQLLGISAAHPSLRSWSECWSVYLPDQTTPYPLDSFPLARAMQGETLDATEMFVRSPQVPEGHWFSVNARSLCTLEGDIHGGIAVFHNITSLKHTEIALRQSENHLREQTQQLQQAIHNLQMVQTQMVQTEKMSSLGQLVAGIAHEINNPVNFIHGNLSYLQNYTQDLLNFISLLQQHYPGPVPAVIQDEAEAIDLEFLVDDLPKIISSMKVGTDRIRQIVLSLRNFSRTDEAEFKAVDIHEGLESTLMILKHRLKARSEHPEIEIIKDYATLPSVECYAGQLNQVFMNILVNAIDAIDSNDAIDANDAINANAAIDEPINSSVDQSLRHAPGCITIRTSVIDGEWVEIAIADNGVGIPQAIQERIFDPFFTTKPIGKGTGMGMSISYQIVTEKHGGKLRCVSTPGRGTEFVIQIPIRQATCAAVLKSAVSA